MHMDALRLRLSEYGEVVGLRRNKVQGTDTYNGLVTAQLLLLKHVPSYIQIGTHSIMFRYAGQPRTCRRCDGAGHEAQGFQRYKCHNCGKIGHHKDACDRDPMCPLCFSPNHSLRSCRDYWECEEDIGEVDPVVPVNDDSQPSQESLGSSIWRDDVPVADVEDSSTSDVVAPATKRPPSASQSTSQIVQATESEQHEGNPQRPQYLTRSSSGPSNTSAIPKPHQSHCSPKPMDGYDTAKRVLEESETESVVSRGANTKTKVKKKTHFTCKADTVALSRIWERQCFFSFGSSHSAGVAVLLNKKFSHKLSSSSYDLNGRWINLSLDIDSTALQLVNIYAPNTIGDKNLLQTAKKRLYDLDIIRISGARIRSKELYFSEFEKSSRYFFSLENKRQQRKVMSSLSSRDGSIVTEPAEILKHISSFYSDLFSSDETDDGCQRFLLDSICLSLPDDPVSKGGLGVTDICMKVQALHLKPLQHIINPNYNAKWIPTVSCSSVNIFVLHPSLFGKCVCKQIFAGTFLGCLP
eukprot:gene16517-18168_t